MTMPPIRNWRIPRPAFYRQAGVGWQFFVYLNPDHNPVLVISKWAGVWYFEVWERFTWRSGVGWHVWPRL